MKKTLAILLMLTLSATMIGCGGKKTSSDTDSSSKAQDTVASSEPEKPKRRNPNLFPIARLGYQPYSGTYPQQSLESYAEAYKMEHRIFLCDIRLTSDNKMVCVHDDDISKVYALKKDGSPVKENEVLISKTTLKSLLNYDFSMGKGTVQPLPVLQLEDFIKFCTKYTDVTPCLEFKVDMTPAQIDKVVALVKKYGYEDKIMFVTPHSNAQLLAPRLPKCTIGRWVNAANDQIIEEMASYGTKAFVYVGKEGNNMGSINPETYSKAQSLGVDLGFTYISVNERALFEELRSRGIINMCKYIGLDEVSWLYE